MGATTKIPFPCEYNPILHLVMFSGGVCSWAAAKRVAWLPGCSFTR